jgi:hypothetical protein
MGETKYRYVLKFSENYREHTPEQRADVEQRVARWLAGEVPVLVLPPGADLVRLDYEAGEPC